MSQDINSAFNNYVPQVPVTYSNTHGQMGREVTGSDGLTMSSVDELLETDKLSEISPVHIIICSSILFLVTGLFFGILITRNNFKTFSFQGSRYEVIGLAEIKDGDKTVYSPVYEVKK